VTAKVYIVGAGPGDPGLLTLRGQACLAAADVVVHDHLVPLRLLAHARAGAELIAVGNPHGDPMRLSQTAIGALLIERARAGRTVVRLKNGDPMLFGRGGEESRLLADAGVAFEVVPGVTSALAVPAYAGIPVTHRDHASVVTIATGHQACGDGPPDLPWDALVRQRGTLVFLMAVRQLEAILTALAAHGLAGDTPAAIVQHGTTARQVTVTATIGTLAARAREAGIGSPAVLVIGAVAGLRDGLAWFEERPLFGRRIVVTRPRAQVAALAHLLEAAGAEVVCFPTIALAPPEASGALDRAVAESAAYDWIVFTSPNGVRAFLDRFAAQARDLRELAGVRLAAIGPETAAELGRHLLKPAVVPAEYRAEGLLEALGDDDVCGRRILLPRAAGARSILPDTLVARGARVDEVIAYRAVPPPDADVAGMRAALASGSIDALTFTSSSTVRNFVALVGPDEVARHVSSVRPVIACIGPITAETARECGLTVAVMPAQYTVPALAAAVIAHLRR
jgi:uroporphyrinogen III methyltransferase/synthase